MFIAYGGHVRGFIPLCPEPPDCNRLTEPVVVEWGESCAYGAGQVGLQRSGRRASSSSLELALAIRGSESLRYSVGSTPLPVAISS
jgi:hypothetical protein